MPSALITGANRGIGLEFARQYAAEGWRVFACCRDPRGAAELEAVAAGSAELVSVHALDVTDRAGIDKVAQELAGHPLDVLVNNAGLIGPPNQGFGHTDYGAWAEVFDVNTMGPMRMAEGFVDHVAASERKLIVTITSGLGSIADNSSGGRTPYRTSKAAVNMVMRGLAVELAPRGIVCVVVSPGWVRTDMGGAGATLAPAESVGALRRLIQRLGPADSGKFFNYNGNEYPW